MCDTFGPLLNTLFPQLECMVQDLSCLFPSLGVGFEWLDSLVVDGLSVLHQILLVLAVLVGQLL